MARIKHLMGLKNKTKQQPSPVLNPHKILHQTGNVKHTPFRYTIFFLVKCQISELEMFSLEVGDAMYRR